MKQIRQEQLQIYQMRAKQTEFFKEGNKWIFKWKDNPIGNYIGRGEPMMMREINHDMFRWQAVDVVIKRHTHVRGIELIDGFWNIYGCGKPPLIKKDYLNHLALKHRGISLTDRCDLIM